MTQDMYEAGEASAEMKGAKERFDAAHREWLCARADMAARHEDDNTEEAEQRRYHRELDAMRALAAVQAPHAGGVWEKWAFVEYLIQFDIEAGQSKYPLVIVALASLKADVLSIGLKRD
jgi:hypothetical protein